MEAISSNMFPLLRKVQKLPETCPHHPDVHLVQLPGHEPFCQRCAQEAKADLGKRIEQSYWARKDRFMTTEVLARESIFDDEDVLACTFDTYDADEGSEAAANKKAARHMAGLYLQPGFQANTIFTGTAGTGKTHLAMGMLHAVNDHITPPQSCLFVSVNELVRQVKASFRYDDAPLNEKSATELLGGVGLLVLDDLGSEAVFKERGGNEASDWVQQLLFGILNKRKGRTIITTNLTNAQMTATYNPKLLSRMYRGIKAANSVIKFTDATTDKRGELF